MNTNVQQTEQASWPIWLRRKIRTRKPNQKWQMQDENECKWIGCGDDDDGGGGGSGVSAAQNMGREI